MPWLILLILLPIIAGMTIMLRTAYSHLSTERPFLRPREYTYHWSRNMVLGGIILVFGPILVIALILTFQP